MTFIDFTRNGGYRLKQYTLRKMQEATFQILKMFVRFCDIPDTGNYIISGCKVVGPNITSGYMYIDGELCFFEQSTGSLASKIKKLVTLESLSFKNGNVETGIFRYTSAVVDNTSNAATLQDFVRVSPVFDPNYIHTDNNFTNAALTKLDGIAAGAEVNVQADCNETDQNSDAFIKNFPRALLPVRAGLFELPNDPNLASVFEVSFADLPNANYGVIGTFMHPSITTSEPISFVVYERTINSFRVKADNGGSNSSYWPYMFYYQIYLIS